MPHVVRKDLVSRDTKAASLSLCTQLGKPSKQKSNEKHCVTVDDFIFLHGKTNVQRESPSTLIRRYTVTVRYRAFDVDTYTIPRSYNLTQDLRFRF